MLTSGGLDTRADNHSGPLKTKGILFYETELAGVSRVLNPQAVPSATERGGGGGLTSAACW